MKGRNAIRAEDEWRSDFPIEESYSACDGRTIIFRITIDDTPTGYLARAEEIESSRGNRHGYTLSKFSPISPYLALGELRDSVRRTLATRYLHNHGEATRMTHDTLVGVIDHSEEIAETVLQVDGHSVTFEQLKNLLSAYEGFRVTIRVEEQ